MLGNSHIIWRETLKQFEKMRHPEKKRLEKRSLKIKHNTSVFASEFVCFYFFFFLCQYQCGSYVVSGDT